MKIEEKNLSRALLVAYGHFETICGAIDKTVFNCSVKSGNSYCSAEFIANKIISLICRKKYLINLKVLVDKALSKTKKQFAKVLILKFVDQVDSTLASKMLNISTRTYFRQINSALEDFFKSLKSLGFTTSKIFDLISEENWILDIYNSYKKSEVCDKKIDNMAFLSVAFKSLKQKSASVF